MKIGKIKDKTNQEQNKKAKHASNELNSVFIKKVLHLIRNKGNHSNSGVGVGLGYQKRIL